MDPDRPNNLILQGLGGPKLITQGLGPDLAYSLGFSYDSRGNLTCVVDPDNGLTYYTYDKVNRMTSVTNPWGETAYYEYSPGGKLLARTLGNGCVTYYDYDRRGVTKVENLKSDLSVISTFEYTRDRTGNPLSILREDGSCVYYEYDPNQQLTAETQTDDLGAAVYAWEWDYDRAGNRLWQKFNGEATYYTYNAGNELLTETADGVTTYYEYDRNGNQTAKDGPDGTTVFHYDFENLLRQIDLPDGAHNYFTYDADSKRKSAVDSSGYTRFIYQGPDMLKLLQERDGAGETKAQYTMGMGLESMRRGAASSFYHYDALGNAQELTAAAEAVTDTYRYNAWGEVLARTGTTANPHQYVGNSRYYGAPDLGLYLLGVRYYSPVLGVFTTKDPALMAAGPEYVYANGNPARLTDPLGLQAGVAVLASRTIAERLLPPLLTPGVGQYILIGGLVIVIGIVVYTAIRQYEDECERARERERERERPKRTCRELFDRNMECTGVMPPTPELAVIPYQDRVYHDRGYEIDPGSVKCFYHGGNDRCYNGSRYYCYADLWKGVAMGPRRKYSVDCCPCCLGAEVAQRNECNWVHVSSDQSLRREPPTRPRERR